MREVYRSTHYTPEVVTRRYVAARAVGGTYRVFEVGSGHKTYRETEVGADQIPEGIREIADCRISFCFNKVEWPL
jgi:hypothetical protein